MSAVPETGSLEAIAAAVKLLEGALLEGRQVWALTQAEGALTGQEAGLGAYTSEGLASLCGNLCSRGPCTEHCYRESRHLVTECACEGHICEVDAGRFAEQVKNCLTMEGIDSAGMTNYDIGMTATRILKDLAEGLAKQAVGDHTQSHCPVPSASAASSPASASASAAPRGAKGAKGSGG